MRLKRGVGIQFNCIFVLIVCAILLTLFIGNIQKQKSISVLSTNVVILNSLGFILSSSAVIGGTVNVVEIPKTRIEFECNKISIGSVSKQLNGMNIFAPRVLDDNNIITMTLDWNVPYRAANFLYLTSAKIRYIFVGNSSFARDIFEMIPDEINNDGYTNVDVIEDENDDSVRLIFFNRDPEIPSNLKEIREGITALKVDGDEDKGKVEFFDFVGDKFESRGISYYFRESGLLGAIFTDNLETYECAMKNSFDGLRVVSQVYEKKTNNLGLYYGNEQCAQNYYSGFIVEIKEASSTFSQSSINEISEAMKNLEEQNKKIQEESCIPIY